MGAATQPPALLHKTLGVSTKVIDDEKGIVEAFVSGIGNKDSVGDIIQPGAFEEFLAKRKPKGVWSHDWDRPVSKTLEIYEVPAGDPRLPLKMQTAGIGGLYVKTQFNLNTQEGRDAYENVKFFDDEAEWSIGYQVHEQEYDKKQKAMLLKKIELFEYSPVLFGANPLTSTVSVKVHVNEQGEIEYETEGLDELQSKAAKAALEVILKEKEVTTEASADEDDTDAREEQNMEAVKSEVSGLWEVELEDGEVKTFRSKEKAEAFIESLKSAEDDEEVVEKAEDATTEEKAEEGESEEKSGESDEAKGEESEEVETKDADESEEKSDEVDTEEKAVAGSYEERYGKLSRALDEEAGRDAYAYPVATFDSSVIYYLYDYTSGEGSYFQCEYSINDEGEVELGESVEVEIVEVVVAKAALNEAVRYGMVDAVKAEIEGLEELAEVSEILEKTAGVIEKKAGRVLSKKNRSGLEKAMEAIQAVLDSDSTEEADEKEAAEDVETKGDEAEVETKDDEAEDVETKDDEVEDEVEVEESEGEESEDAETEDETEDEESEAESEEDDDEEDEETEGEKTVDSDAVAMLKEIAELEILEIELDGIDLDD